MASVVTSSRREITNHSAMVKNRLNGKLDKMSRRRDRPLRNSSHSNVVITDGGELPKFVLDLLSLGPKHPAREKFNEMHIPTDAEKFVRELRQSNTDCWNLFEIEESMKRYAKKVSKTPTDRRVKKTLLHKKTQIFAGGTV